MTNNPPEPIRVYSKPACVQCNATYRRLDEKGVPYKVTDLTADPAALDYVKSLGYLEAPVVVVSDTEHWSGFRDDLIDNLAARVNEAAA